MAKLSHDDALAAVYAGRLNRDGDLVEIPIAALIEKIDVNMAPLPPVALYVYGEGKRDLLKPADQPYSPLALSLHETVWVREEDLPKLKKYAESLILSSAGRGSKGVDPTQRMETLRKTAIVVVDDLFQNPSAENIERSTKVVSSFVYVLMKDPKAYMLLTKLSSHDPYTLQHSVGTAVNSIILARKTGITEEKELMEIGLGGLLHDIGKVRVRKEVINKNGPLDDVEWEEMRQHAQEGYDIVKDNYTLSEKTKRAILEHHEDKNGSGYPQRLKWDQVAVCSKIVAISDVFNALTTNRSYSKARTAFEAFEFIRDKLNHKVDDRLFEQLVLVYGGKLPG